MRNTPNVRCISPQSDELVSDWPGPMNPASPEDQPPSMLVAMNSAGAKPHKISAGSTQMFRFDLIGSDTLNPSSASYILGTVSSEQSFLRDDLGQTRATGEAEE